MRGVWTILIVIVGLVLLYFIYKYTIGKKLSGAPDDNGLLGLFSGGFIRNGSGLIDRNEGSTEGGIGINPGYIFPGDEIYLVGQGAYPLYIDPSKNPPSNPQFRYIVGSNFNNSGGSYSVGKYKGSVPSANGTGNLCLVTFKKSLQLRENIGSTLPDDTDFYIDCVHITKIKA